MSEVNEMPAEMSAEKKEGAPAVDITVSDGSGIHKFGSWEEVMRYREEQNENSD